MKLTYGDFTIPCKVGDTIKFELEPTGTLHHAMFNLGEETKPLEENKAFRFKCEMEAYEHTPPLMILNFSEPEGGKYHIKAVRHDGSSKSLIIKQQSGSRIKILRFGLEGDPYTDFD